MSLTTVLNMVVSIIIVSCTMSSSYATELDTEVSSKLKFKGDLRLRDQSENLDSGVSRQRYRIRFRLGGESNISEQTSVKFGLASGGVDPRSTNQTLQNSFQTPDIRLDYAFVKHQYSSTLTGFAGKMKNPLFKTSDMLWDSDINPEGVAARYKTSFFGVKSFINGGYFVLDELSANENDIYLISLQQGGHHKVNSSTSFNGAIGYYQTQNLKGNILDNSAETNTGSTTGLPDDFASIVVSGKLSFSNILGVALISPFAEVVTNVNQDSNNNGGIFGVKVGDEKLNAPKKWQSTLSYRYLQADAWLDIFPDSDAYGGSTNIEGFEVKYSYATSNKSKVTVDVYMTDIISGTSDAQFLGQLDYSYKF